jgi:chaperone modulatory protein CbpM
MEKLIAVEVFCVSHEVEIGLIHSIHDLGLIELQIVEEKYYVSDAQLGDLERILRIHRDLEINLEGVDAISHLLHRIEEMQSEIEFLRKRLKIFEE